MGAQGFGRWLDQWRALRLDGWDVTVLVALDNSHAIGLAVRARRLRMERGNAGTRALI